MWSDKETTHDCLGYTSYVDVLSEVCLLPDLSPLTLGIFGAWGSGKTSLMTMLRERLDRDADASKTKTLWFNAWKYEGADESQSVLIRAILDKLIENRSLMGDAKATLDRLIKGADLLKVAKAVAKSAITLTPDIMGLLGALGQQTEEVVRSMERFEQDFEQLLEEVDVSHIVVFIDDLDRCPSSKVIDTFETIKLFLNTPRCTFVIGADAQRIMQAVADVYGVTDAGRKKDFLEKIVQLPFNIPVQSLPDIACYVGMLVLGKHLKTEEGWKSLVERQPKMRMSGTGLRESLLKWAEENELHLDGCGRDFIAAEIDGLLPYVPILGSGLSGNPRQIKRFLNILALRRRLATANNLIVDDSLLIKMAVLEYVWEDFFGALVETMDPATGNSLLVAEIMPGESSQLDGTSDLAAGFAGKPQLLTFLRGAPALTSATDLRPYMFLAQTSIGHGKQALPLTPDARAQAFAESIASRDRIVSKANALRVAAEDDTAAEAVLALLTKTLSSSRDVQVRAHILVGMDLICSRHRHLYKLAVDALGRIDPDSHVAIGLAGGTLLANANGAGQLVAEELTAKYRKAAGPLGGLSGTRSAKGGRS